MQVVSVIRVQRRTTAYFSAIRSYIYIFIDLIHARHGRDMNPLPLKNEDYLTGDLRHFYICYVPH